MGQKKQLVDKWIFFNWIHLMDTIVHGQGREKNNSKNKCQNFREIIFFKKIFFVR
jgi:hypothetical protein